MKFIAVLLALYAMCASAFIAPSAGEFGESWFPSLAFLPSARLLLLSSCMPGAALARGFVSTFTRLPWGCPFFCEE